MPFTKIIVAAAITALSFRLIAAVKKIKPLLLSQINDGGGTKQNHSYLSSITITITITNQQGFHLYLITCLVAMAAENILENHRRRRQLLRISLPWKLATSD